MFRPTLTTLFSLVCLCAAGCGGEEDFAGETDLSDEVDPEAEAALEGAEQPLFGSDACRDVDLKIINSFEDGARSARIRVEYLKFFSASEGRWITEDVANTEIAYGASNWWYNEDLQYAENDTITQWRVYFRYIESDNDWSDLVYQTIDTVNDVCHADDDYAMTVN